jgi:hypothetical protein
MATAIQAAIMPKIVNARLINTSFPCRLPALLIDDHPVVSVIQLKPAPLAPAQFLGLASPIIAYLGEWFGLRQALRIYADNP